MCGFVGTVRLDGRPVERASLLRMRDALRHRGPDDAGVYVHGNVGLGHQRLSIQDLSPAGHQPMTNEDGSLWLVFNGEIYNYVELAADLRRRGHQFRSRTDSEVILHMYEDEGERCVDHFDGMFAFAIWDSRRQVLFGARDRTGIKPFNYYLGQDRFICASEIKTILADPSVPREANPPYFAEYIFAGSSNAGRTPFKGILELAPGHTLTLTGRQLEINQYWDVQYNYNRSRSLSRTVDELRDLLDQSIRVHCRSDASLGCHLSGGLDSSGIVAHAARYREPLKTFTIRFEGQAFDETPYAKIVSRAFATEYIEASPQMGELSALLPKLIWHMDMPLAGDTGFAYYAASRLAAQHVKVSLTGHGGDELFGGYPAQLQAAFGSQVSGSHAQANGGSASWVQRLGRLWRRQGVRGLVDRLQNRLKPASNQFEKLWIDLHTGVMPQNSVLNPAFLRSLAGYSPIDDYLRPLRAVSDAETLDRCLYHDLKSYLPGLLHAEDRMSMAFSLESRVPLLDHHIIEFLATVPPSQKLPRLEPKALLCDAIGPLLPAEIMQRKTKVNFATPIREWVQTDLPPLARAVLLSPRCLDRGVLDPDELRSKTTRPGQLWIGLNIELWHRIFIDNDLIEVEQKAEVESVREMKRPTTNGRSVMTVTPK